MDFYQTVSLVKKVSTCMASTPKGVFTRWMFHCCICLYIYINYKCIFAYSILYLSTVQSPTDTFKTPRYIISFVFFAGPGCDLQVAS